MSDPDESQFPSPLSALPRGDAATRYTWMEDKLIPISQEEFTQRLRETMAMAREKGWIPAKDPGCQCLTCRQFRKVFP